MFTRFRALHPLLGGEGRGEGISAYPILFTSKTDTQECNSGKKLAECGNLPLTPVSSTGQALTLSRRERGLFRAGVGCAKVSLGRDGPVA